MTKHSKRLILIDDNPHIIESIELTLNSHNIEINGFTNGNEAIKFIKDTDFSGVIICDAQMPQIDGWDTILELSKLGIHDRIIINMLTGVAEPPDKSNACAGHIFDYLKKPYKGKELIELVERSFSNLLEESA